MPPSPHGEEPSLLPLAPPSSPPPSPSFPPAPAAPLRRSAPSAADATSRLTHAEPRGARSGARSIPTPTHAPDCSYPGSDLPAELEKLPSTDMIIIYEKKKFPQFLGHLRVRCAGSRVAPRREHLVRPSWDVLCRLVWLSLQRGGTRGRQRIIETNEVCVRERDNGKVT